MITVIAGQGAAPRLATLRHFKGRDGIPARGIEAAAVPAALDACLTLLDRFGTMTFTQVIAPTQALLRRPARPAAWHADFARTLETLVDAEAQAHSSGSASPAGDRTRGLRLVADAFYRGPIARRIDAWSSAHGGLIRYVDLATHTTRVEEPVVGAISRADHLQVRAMDPGPLPARGPANPQGYRPEGDGTQLALTRFIRSSRR